MKIRFNLSSKQNQGGLQEIYLLTSIKRNGKVINMRAKSNVYALPSLFDATKGIDLSKKRVLSPIDRESQNEQKARLDALLSAIQSAEIATSRESINKDWFKMVVDKFNHPESYQAVDNKTIWEKAQSYIESHKAEAGTKDRSKFAVRAMFRYEAYVKEIDGSDFTWNHINDIKESDLEDFIDFLMNEAEIWEENPLLFDKIVSSYPSYFQTTKRRLIGMGEHTILRVIQSIRPFISYLVKNDKAVTRNPFIGFKYEVYQYGEPYVMTEEERDTLANTQMPSKDLELVRDRFIFQSYIGARQSDLCELTENNLNNGVLEYFPIKTNRRNARKCEIPLSATAMNLIEKYKGVDKEGRLMPLVKIAKYNKQIKKCFTIAGLNRNICVKDSKRGETVIKPLCEIASSHLARRTFVGIPFTYNVPLQVIGSMSGHAPHSREISRYYKVDMEQKKEAIKKLDGGKNMIDLDTLTESQRAQIQAIIANNH